MILNPIGPEIPINTTDGDDIFPQAVALIGGGFVVHWIDIGHISGDTAVKAQVHDANGQPVGDEITVGLGIDDPFFLVPTVIALAHGGFAVAYLDPNTFDEDDPVAWDLKVRTYTDQGLPASDLTTVTSAVVGGRSKFDIVALANGGFVATWQDDSDGNGDDDESAILAQIFDKDGGAVEPAFLVNTDVVGDQIAPRAVLLANDRFAVVWQDTETSIIAGQVFLEDGTPFNNQITFSPDLDAFILTGAEAFQQSGFLVTWISGDIGGSGTDVALKAAIATNNGSPLEAETVNETPLNIVDAILTHHEIVPLADGSLMVIWTDLEADGTNGTAIRGQRFGTDGQALGDEVTLLEPEETDTPFVVDAKPLPDGGFVLIRTDGEFAVIEVEAYSSDGTSLGEPYEVPGDAIHFAATVFGFDPDAIAVLENGQIIVPWSYLDLGVDVAAQALAFGTQIVSDGGGAAAALKIDENTRDVTTVQSLDHGDPLLTYSIVGGADMAHFAIDPISGTLSFKTAPDFEAPTDGNSDNTYDVVVEANNGIVSGIQTLAVMIGDVASLTLAGTKKKDTLTGADENDSLKGRNGKDILDGGAGDDRLKGGKKKDTLTGGEGADGFVFHVELKNKWADTITDFEASVDTIHLHRDVFKTIGKAGPLKDKYFDTGKSADGKKDRVLYDEATGWLRYDEDGAKGKHDPVKVAKILADGGPVQGLSAGDILII